MPNSKNATMAEWLKCFCISIFLVLPARAYNGYYLHAFATESNLSVQYLNLVDLSALLISFLFVVGHRFYSIEAKVSKIGVAYSITNLIMLLGMALSGNSAFIGELISKTLIVLCAVIIVSGMKDYSDVVKSTVYLTALGVLVVASFFLSGYQGYGVMNRVGSLGFGTNETANFACCIIAICLVVTNINIWLRLISIGVSTACIFNVASRRGIIVMAVIIIIWLLTLLWKKKQTKIARRTFFTSILVVLVIIIFVATRYNQILYFFQHSSLAVRFRFAERYNNEFMDYSNRLSIFDSSFDYIKNHILMGSFGSDKLYAQGHYTHAHNILLQFITTYGIFFGAMICLYIVTSLYRAVVLLKDYFKHNDNMFPAIISIFYIVYLTFESFGYLLWNPKGLFWIAITVFFIDIEYRRLKQTRNGNIHEVEP